MTISHQKGKWLWNLLVRIAGDCNSCMEGKYCLMSYEVNLIFDLICFEPNSLSHNDSSN